MKQCTRCGETKPLAEYYAHPKTRDGHLGKCKACCKAYASVQNKEKRKYGDLETYKRMRADQAIGKYESNKRRRRRKLAYYAEKSAFRNASKIQATPPWLTDDQKWMISEIYELRMQRQEITGVEHHVDHIVPLLGKEARGLHVPWNLRVVTAEINLRKSNKVEC